MQERARRVADAITWLRILGIPVIWVYALLGDGRAVGAGLIVAGISDYLDGFIARRFGQASRDGARLDLTADTLVLVSGMAWIALLHPEITGDNGGLIALTLFAYVTAAGLGLVKFHRLPNLHLYSSRVAGGLLYAFGVITLITGHYNRLLLALAAFAFVVSCVETFAGQLLFSVVDANIGSVLLVRRQRSEIMTAQAGGSDLGQR